MPSQTLDLRPRSPLTRKILRAVSDRIRASQNAMSTRHQKWRLQEEAATAYVREDAADLQKSINRDYYGKPELTTIKVPYSYGVLMASHTYWTTVFLSRTPVFQFTGRHGETQQQIQALEALIAYQVQVGEMLVPLYLWLLDPGKYGIGIVAVDWIDKYSVVSSIEEVPILIAGVLDTGRTKKRKISQRIPGYSGNMLTNVRPYDWFPDPRVTVRNFQKGEFCGLYVQIGWNDILKRTEQGYYIQETVDRLRNRQGGGNTWANFGRGGSGESRVEGSDQVQLPDNYSFDLDGEVDSGAEKSKRNIRNASVPAYEMHIELVPYDWGLGGSKYPEKWVFTVTADYEMVLGAQPLGANHDKFPFSVLEYEPEGYAIASRGIGEVLKPVNDTMDWLINSHLYNVRKTLNDQFVVDPTRINMSDFENPMPGGVIRLTPAGGSINDAIQQLNVTDVTRTHLADMNALLSIGQRTVGVNDQMMGQILPTGRRSATEVRTGSGFGVNRLKTNSEFFSAMGWGPLSSMMVQNSQQYYEMDKKFRIVGQLAQEAGQEFVNVTPEKILGDYDFVTVDGTQPIDRIAQAQLWTNIFGQIVNFPDIMMRYDIGRIFEWVAQLAGLKNISQFRIDMVPDDMLANQVQAGNVVPIPERGGGGGPSGVGANPAMSSAGGAPSPSPNPPLNIAGGGPQDGY